MNSKGPPHAVTAIAPGKVILFGEHAINRGQPAIAAGVGLYTRCNILLSDIGQYQFRSGTHTQSVSRQDIVDLKAQVEQLREGEDYAGIRALVRGDYFAASKYVLACAFGDALPHGLEIGWESEVPSSSGLGSGGSAFTALVAAISPFFYEPPDLEQRASWAHRGDILAHGGIASALDTQTSLLGGVIRYTGQGLAAALPFAPGLSIVIGHTGVVAATGEVNGRVRSWLAERPKSRMAYFEAIGALARTAQPLLETGNWPELGRLFTLNQLALAKIGVSCPQIDTLIEASLEAGAWGAKLSGSGGGGIIIALTSSENRQAVAAAIELAGGKALIPEIGVAGVQINN